MCIRDRCRDTRSEREIHRIVDVREFLQRLPALYEHRKFGLYSGGSELPIPAFLEKQPGKHNRHRLSLGHAGTLREECHVRGINGTKKNCGPAQSIKRPDVSGKAATPGNIGSPGKTTGNTEGSRFFERLPSAIYRSGNKTYPTRRHSYFCTAR